MNWSNFGDDITVSYNSAKAGKFTWAYSYDYGTFDFHNYFENLEIDVPCHVEADLINDEVNITSVSLDNFSATNKGESSNEIFADVTIGADASAMVNINFYDKKGKLLDYSIVSTYPGKHTTILLIPKQTAKITFSNTGS